MNIHPVEKFLSEGGTICQLKSAPYHLNIREELSDGGKPVLVIDYDQINSPRFNSLTDACRGIVLCQETNKVVCWPFNRFYNAGENSLQEKEFDWDTAVCASKEDGSLIKVYHFDGRWNIATRGTAFARNTIYNLIGEESKITFAELFLRTLNLDDAGFQEYCNASFIAGETVLFELCTKENRVVTTYENDVVFVLGIRNRDGEEGTIMSIKLIDGMENVGIHAMYDMDGVISAARELTGLREGFVVRDIHFNRVKVKSPVYVIAHHSKGSVLTPRRAVDLILLNEQYEFISYFPEYKDFIGRYETRYVNILRDAQLAFDTFNHIEDKKEFALKVKDYAFSCLVFSMRNGFTVNEAWERLTDNGRYTLLGAK